MDNNEVILKEGLDRFELASNTDCDQRDLAIEDLRFVDTHNGQWEQDIYEKRHDKPRYTIDRISGAIDQIVGNQRQTKNGIKVSPQTDANDKTANIYTGLIRSIEKVSNANNVYDSAFTEALKCGYGGFRAITDFESDASFDQTIKIKSINSAASSLYFDPSAEEYDKRDAQWAFLISYMELKEFKEVYPKASVTDFNQGCYDNIRERGWFPDKGVRIAEYWYKKPYKQKKALLTDGRVIDLDEEKSVLDELAEGLVQGSLGVTIAKDEQGNDRIREVDAFKIEMVLMNGAEVLTKPQEWAGKFIPLVPVFGKTAKIDGDTFTWGIVRKAIDAQRIYNYATSAAIEATALTPKDPYFQTPIMIAGHEQQWKTFNTKNPPTMLYNADASAPGPPQRGGAPQLQTALLQQVSQASTDIHSTTGIEPASMGNVPELKSGKAIQAQQAMGDRGSFIYQDNLAKSQQYLGDILVDLISKIYDGERIIKVLGVDETTEDIIVNQLGFNEINQEIIDEETGEQVIVNDLSQGTYSVSISTGPSFQSRKEETVNQLISLSSTNPLVAELALDLLIDNMELNNGDEMKKRIRKNMIQKGLVEPTEEETKDYELDKPPEPDPMNEALVTNLNQQTEKLQVEVEKLISEIKNKDADTQNKIMSAQKDSITGLEILVKTVLSKLDAGLPPNKEDSELIEGQQALVGETQIDVLEGQEIAESLPMDVKPQESRYLEEGETLQQFTGAPAGPPGKTQE